jgi:hypothetical protein
MWWRKVRRYQRVIRRRYLRKVCRYQRVIRRRHSKKVCTYQRVIRRRHSKKVCRYQRVIRRRNSRKVCRYQRVIRRRHSRKDTQCNGQRKITKWQRRVWRYQRGNQNPCIEEDTKLKTKDWATRTVTCILCIFFYLHILNHDNILLKHCNSWRFPPIIQSSKLTI